jgi:hypothetical protein
LADPNFSARFLFFSSSTANFSFISLLHQLVPRFAQVAKLTESSQPLAWLQP